MLAKILKEIDNLKKLYVEKAFVSIDEGNLPCKYDKSDIEAAKVQALSEAMAIIRKHLSGKDTNVPANDGWILTETCPMPENDGMYEVTRLVNGQYETAYIKQEGGWSSCVGPMEGKIIAWRFGPEPYRPEKGEE